MENENQTAGQQNIASPAQEQTETVSLDDIRGLPFSEGGSKPVFNTITKAMVKEAVLKKSRMASSEDKNYEALFLQVTCEVPGAEDFWENYGGFRIYEHKDPKDESKKTKTLWTGTDSFGGQLRSLMRDTFGEEVYTDLALMVEKLQGCEVGVKTEKSLAFGGGESSKIVIKQVYPVDGEYPRVEKVSPTVVD